MSEVVIETRLGYFQEVSEKHFLIDVPKEMATTYPDPAAAREVVKKFRLDERDLVAGLDRR